MIFIRAKGAAHCTPTSSGPVFTPDREEFFYRSGPQTSPILMISSSSSVSINEALRFLLADETAAELTSRMARERLITSLPPLDNLSSMTMQASSGSSHPRGLQGGVRPGMMVEIQGPCGSGKTRLLMQAAVNCLINGAPKMHQHQPWPQQSDGQGAPARATPCWVLFIDLDSKFDMVQMVTLLKQGIESLLIAMAPDQDPDVIQGRNEWAQSVFETCLSRFHLMTPGSSLEVLTSLLSAHTFFSRADLKGVSKLLLIDDVSAFSSIDKAAKENMYITTPSSSSLSSHQSSLVSSPVLTLARMHATMASLVKRASMDMRCCVLCSSYVLFTQPSFSGSASVGGGVGGGGWMVGARDLMTSSWQESVTHRLILSSPVVAGDETRVGVAARVETKGQELHQGGLYTMVIRDTGLTFRLG